MTYVGVRVAIWQYIRARALVFVAATFCTEYTVQYSMYIRYSNLSTSPASRRLAGNASKELVYTYSVQVAP
jgi:hypothetical protein